MASTSQRTKPSTSAQSSPGREKTGLGLLFRKVFHSPEIRHIHPIQIRGPRYSDVALVGEHHVEIKHASFETGRLHHVATKADFGSRICAAQTLGSPLYGNPENDEDRRAIEEEKWLPNQESSTPWPPQLLLLTLDSNVLVFLSMFQEPQQQAFQFHTSSLALPHLSAHDHGPPSNVDKSVHFMAVDPISRAIAVASSSGQVFFCGLTSRSLWGRDVAESTILQQSFNADMGILQMSFLRPPTGQRDQVYLLLIGALHSSRNRQGMRLYTWRYDSTEPPAPLELHIPHKFITDHETPKVLVPLFNFPGSFLLICDRSAAIYDDVLLGTPVQRYMLPLKRFVNVDDDPSHSSLTTREPLWMSWCRPPRYANNTETECLYLLREDGVVCYVEARRYSWNRICAGRVNGVGGDAFNHDGRSTISPDGIIFGGTQSDGGIYEIGRDVYNNETRTKPTTRLDVMTLQQTETLYNWAPFLDLAIDPSGPSIAPQTGLREDEHRQTTQRLFGTSGKSLFGAISQLRYGHEAIVDEAFATRSDDDDEDQDLENIFARLGPSRGSFATRLWSIGFGYNRWAFLVSTPTHTVLSMDPRLDIPEEAEPPPFEEGTLAAAILQVSQDGPWANMHLVLLVSPLTVSVIRVSLENPYMNLETSIKTPGPVISAAIEPNAPAVLVVIGKSILVSALSISDTGIILGWGRGEVNINEDPTCATLFALNLEDPARTPNSSRGRSNPNLVGAVGTSAGKVVLIGITSADDLSTIATLDLASLTGSATAQSCSSMTVLSNAHDATKIFLLCGLRNGRLISIALSINMPRATVRTGRAQMLTLGNSAVDLRPDPRHPFIVFAGCDGNAIRLDFSTSLYAPTLNYVWFVNKSDRSQQATVTDLSVPESRDWVGEQPLAALCGDQILIARLGDHAKPVPLRLPLERTPSRLIYSKIFKCFFVAAYREQVHEGTRYTFPQILILNTAVSDYRHPTMAFSAEPGQEITWMTEWSFKRDGKLYYYLVVTTKDETNDGEVGGTVILLQMARYGNTPGVQRSHTSSFSECIYAICPYDHETLLFCTNTTIKRWTMTPGVGEGGALVQTATRTVLHHPGAGSGQYITVQRPFVHVSFGQGSTRVFKFGTNGMLDLVTSDNRSRYGLSHLPLKEHGVLLLTDKKRGVVGLHLPEVDSSAEQDPPLFEANLPTSITRICKACVRPPWKWNGPSSAVERDLIGTSPDGSAWMFSIFREPTWRLLRFIQNMCMRREELWPFPDREVMEQMHIEPEATKPHHFQVDGDILGRLVSSAGPEQLLNRMLDIDPLRVPGGRVDFDTAVQRRRRFGELVQNMLHENGDEASNLNEVAVAIEVVRRAVELPF